MQSKEKISKIIEEFALFVFVNHSSNLNIDVKKMDDTIYFTFTTDLMNEEIIEFIKEKAGSPRSEEIEEYGWELMGEGASDDDLGIIGSLIDSLEFENTENKTIIRMMRNESY